MEEDTEIKSFAEGDTARRNIRALHHSWTRGPGVVHTAFHLHRIIMAVKDTDTLVYKLFGMTKKEWDMEVKRHQKKLNKREREYMLTFRKHQDKEKK